MTMRRLRPIYLASIALCFAELGAAKERAVKVIGSAACSKTVTPLIEIPAEFAPTFLLTDLPLAAWTTKGTYEFRIAASTLGNPALAIVFARASCLSDVPLQPEDCSHTRTALQELTRSKACIGGATSVPTQAIRFSDGQPYIYVGKFRLTEPCTVPSDVVGSIVSFVNLVNACSTKAEGLSAPGRASDTFFGMAGLVPLLTAATAGVVALRPEDPIQTTDFRIDSLSTKSPAPEDIVLLGMDVTARNPGFHTTPKRDVSQAVFWNASALSMSLHGQVGAFIGLDYAEIAFGKPRSGGFGWGVGYLARKQFRGWTASFGGGRQHQEALSSWLHLAALSASGRLSDDFSVGVALKVVGSSSRTPTMVRQERFEDGSVTTRFLSDTESSARGDFDVSSTWRASERLTIGATVQSVLNHQLQAGPEGAGGLRAFSIGAHANFGQLQLGMSATRRESGSAVVAFGVELAGPKHLRTVAGAVLSDEYRGVSLGAEWRGLSYRFSRDGAQREGHVVGFSTRFW